MKTFKYFFLFIFFLSLLSSALFSGAGRSGWTIFKKARSAKFKGVTTTIMVRGDLSGVLFNPAIVGTGVQKELFFLSHFGMIDEKFGGLIFGQPLSNGMLACGAVYYDAGMMELNWIEKDELRSKTVMAQQDVLGLLSYGHRFNDSLFAGLTVKTATSRVAELNTAMAYALDAGIFMTPAGLFDFMPAGVSLSAAVQNLGGATKFNKKESPLPAAGFFAVGYQKEMGSLYFLPNAGMTYYMVDEQWIPDTGIEIGYGLASINLGYRFSPKGESNIHLGFGLNFKSFDMAYSFLPGIYLNPVHQMSVGYRFGSISIPGTKEIKIEQEPVKEEIIPKPVENAPVEPPVKQPEPVETDGKAKALPYEAGDLHTQENPPAPVEAAPVEAQRQPAVQVETPVKTFPAEPYNQSEPVETAPKDVQPKPAETNDASQVKPAAPAEIAPVETKKEPEASVEPVRIEPQPKPAETIPSKY